MGYRGKLEERARARELRAQVWTLPEIAEALGVARSSVSVWVRDVPFDASARRSARTGRRPRGDDHPLRRRKQAEIARFDALGRERLATLTERESLVAGLGLYAGDGSKRDGEVQFANSDPDLVRFFCGWLRRHFTIDEARLRLKLYLHQGLDLDRANTFWSGQTGIPIAQFRRPYRATPDATIRRNKHEHGCAHVAYCCAATHREIMGLLRGMLQMSVARTADDHLEG